MTGSPCLILASTHVRSRCGLLADQQIALPGGESGKAPSIADLSPAEDPLGVRKTNDYLDASAARRRLQPGEQSPRDWAMSTLSRMRSTDEVESFFGRDVVAVSAVNEDHVLVGSSRPGGPAEYGSERIVSDHEMERLLGEVTGRTASIEVHPGGSGFNMLHALARMDIGLRLGLVAAAGEEADAQLATRLPPPGWHDATHVQRQRTPSWPMSVALRR
jgi:hypothetical protein